MSSTNIEDVKEQVLDDDTPKNQVHGDNSAKEYPKDLDKDDEISMHSPQQEEEKIKEKYGGLLPKKKPLISKDHEHAFFDSADWALGKQGGQKPKGPLEALQPKWEPTPHHSLHSRRSAYASADDRDVPDEDNHGSPEDENCMPKDGNDKYTTPEEQKYHD